MANRTKSGLDYFPMDVNFFSDIKCRKLLKKYGSGGITLYIYLICRIYEDGYYLEIDDDLIFFTSESLKLDEFFVKEMLNFMFKIGFFDEFLAQKNNILTSKGIQNRYSEIAKIARRKKVIEKYSLINVQECTNNVQESNINVQESTINVQDCTNNAHFCNKEKKRKEKERKVKEKEKEKKEKVSSTSTSKKNLEVQKKIYFCIDELFKILSADDYWIEISAKSHQTEIDEIQIAIPKFLLHLKSSGTEIKSIQDAKSHFNNWFRKIRQIEPKSNGDGATKIGRLSPNEINDFIKNKKSNHQ
jgi:hypothetical protein